MNDESKRRLAASLEKPLDPKKDRQLVDAIEKDPQAKAWVAGLKTVDSALRRWPSPARSANEWEDFAARLEQRLGESPSSASSSRNDSFDPLAPPVLEGDDGDAQRVEQTSMGSPDKNDDDDLEALAALTRSSTAPTSLAPPPKAVSAGPALHDDAMDESSGIVDMKQLAELALKQPVPPPAGALAPTPADTTGRSDAAVMAGEKPTAREAAAVPPASAAAEAKSAKAAPVHAAPAKASEPEKKGGVSWVLWITPVIAAAAAGGFFFMKSNAEHAANTASTDTVEQREVAPSTPTAAAPAAPPAQPAVAPPAPPTVAMNGPEEQPGGAAPTAESAPAPTQAAPQPPEAAPTVGAAPSANATAGAVARNEPAADDSDRNADHHATRSARANTVAAADTTAAEGGRHESDGDQGAAANTRSGSRGAGSAAATGAPAAAPPPANTASTTTVAAAPAARTPTPAAAAAAPAGGSAGGARSMDELMATAVGGSHGGGGSTTAAANLGQGSGGAAASAGDALPDRPSRAQVTATMTPLSPAVRACTQGQTGVATVAMVIRSDGTVQSASVSGPFSADANTCITGVVRRAHFTAFTRPSVPIVYPFSIQPPRPGAQ